MKLAENHSERSHDTRPEAIKSREVDVRVQ